MCNARAGENIEMFYLISGSKISSSDSIIKKENTKKSCSTITSSNNYSPGKPSGRHKCI